ncbi:peptidoglycan-binding domain-containing protein [Microvirga subterranea]|uniref:peptidoglycan-binding domain-containing protein n=1 Tax=Microvirga subterranea TaxID=186651 RepID=UPI000E0CB4FF
MRVFCLLNVFFVSAIIAMIMNLPAGAGVICQETVYNPNLVRNIQDKLRRTTAKKLRLNGKWDANTIAALKVYQKSNGLEQTGDLDSETFSSMFGKDSEYEPISRVVTNPHNAPDDVFRRFCR